MPRSPDREIVQGYIEEVKTYIPSLISGLEAMRSGVAPFLPEQGLRSGHDSEILEEIHRLVHTVKGASAMVGIFGLSYIAAQMEDALDEIIVGDRVFTEEDFQVMSGTVEHFQTYCRDFLEKGVDSHRLLTETVLAFRRLRKLPPEEDENILQKLKDIVPEHERGTEENSQVSETLKSETPRKESFSVSDSLHIPELNEDEVSLMALLDEVPETDTEENMSPPVFPEMTADSGAEFAAGSQPRAQENSESPLSREFLESFYEEAEEHFQDMRVSLKILESQIIAPVPVSESCREIIRRIRQSVHTLKGASSVLRLMNISAYAGRVEDFLGWLCETAGEIKPETVSVLAESADLLEAVVADPDRAQIQKEKSLKARYREIKEGSGGGASELSAERISKPERTAKPQTEITEIPPELLESFYEEAEGHFQDLGRSLGILESQVSIPCPISPEHREIIRQIRRSVHTLKGAASVVGVPNVSSFAHSAEDLLDWLYETAREITPEIIAVLASSADLLESLAAHPENAHEPEALALREKFGRIADRGDGAAPSGDESYDSPLPDQMTPDPEPLNPAAVPSSLSSQPSTLRVSMDRLEEMSALTGELTIALSAFDQGMDAFRNAVSEIELARERLKDIARDMEIGYEVRSLGRLTPVNRKMKYTEGRDALPRASVQGDYEDFDALELDRYSELNLIIRTLNESAVDVGAISTQLATLHSEFDGNITRQRVLLGELADKMMRIRMTPMQAITNRLRRTVRDVSSKLGKNIRLIIEGEDIELDREIWEKMTDPLMHLLRNAADHGIESPQQRTVSGKPPAGILKLAGSREGNQVVIRISDDGAGLNREAIRKTAVSSGFSEKTVAEMSEEELTSLIFLPGFSTRREISEISGRGVGMDAVKQNIAELKGDIRVFSQEGKGTRFTVRIPITLAVIRGLLFTAGGHKYALALNEIKEIIRIGPDDVIPGPPQETVIISDEVMPLYHGATLLNIAKGSGVRGTGSFYQGGGGLVLVVRAGDRLAALVIDTLEGQREIVIKSMGTHLRYVKGVSGVTVMGDGSVVPILNCSDLFTSGQRSEVSPLSSHPSALTPQQIQRSEVRGQRSATSALTPQRIMIVDDSVSIRQVVTRLMEEQGWSVQTAKDGIDALEKLRESMPDLIVLDIEMPRMNGYEFLNALRVQPAYRDIPVIMLTSRAVAKHRDKALSLGAKGFITKPYNNEEFIALIQELTG
ncbi:MAG: hypothetical protein BWK80_16990 [Desulfobacteraceae bacterium IS3]|nr:MAG: hypothetical protein BWK80_16990 [Desulfobacteraceae bacterium IS3]